MSNMNRLSRMTSTARVLYVLRVAFTVAAILFGAYLVWAGIASAAGVAPGWEAVTRVSPTSMPPGGEGVLTVYVYNVGAATGEGATALDTLPANLTATGGRVYLYDGGFVPPIGVCSGTRVVGCSLEDVPPGKIAVIEIPVVVSAGAVSGSVESNEVTVAGGGALSPASSSQPVIFSNTPAGFGLAGVDGWFTNTDGTTDTQAGSHPYEFTFAFNLNSLGFGFGEYPAGGEPRVLNVNLPPGFVGDPNALPQCTREQFDAGDLEPGKGCPASTQIGVDTVALRGSEGFTNSFPIYNLVPPPGVAAQFAFDFNGVLTFLDAGVRSGSDYGITEHIDNVPQREIIYNTTTIWGVPAEGSHDAQRKGPGCEHGCSTGSSGFTPLLTLPTSCGGPQEISADIPSIWQGGSTSAEDSLKLHDNSGLPVGFTGCDFLGFGPSISAAPDTSSADTPAGLTVQVKTPQEGLSSIEQLATSNIKDTTVVLPEGLVINPGQATGLQACQESEAHLHLEEVSPECPSASKVGTVEIETPLLRDTLEGDVYVLQSNPPNLRLLVSASADGVNIKLVADVHLNEVTGQLTTTFSETPELPFTDFKLAFSGGAQAALVTPTGCGEYTTTSRFHAVEHDVRG